MQVVVLSSRLHKKKLETDFFCPVPPLESWFFFPIPYVDMFDLAGPPPVHPLLRLLQEFIVVPILIKLVSSENTAPSLQELLPSGFKGFSSRPQSNPRLKIYYSPSHSTHLDRATKRRRIF